MTAHGLICPGSIPVCRIQNFGRNGAFHLQQATSLFIFGWIAPDEFRRYLSHRRHRLLWLDEGALQMLLSKINYPGKGRRATNSAGLSIGKMHSFSAKFETYRGRPT